VASPVTVTFLGGLGEVGRNCTCVEVDGKLLLIDFGVMFPDATMPGVDVILPNTEWLRERADDVVGLVITHAHEDHVGGVPYFLREFEAPLFGSPLSMGIAANKVAEARLENRTTLHALADGERRQIGPFDVEVLPITHSVPQSLCVVLHTPQGVLVHTGDFKLDHTPVDDRLTDLGRLGALGKDPGIRLLMADSTNADTPGHSDSESEIGQTFRRLFPDYRGRRLIVSCFASHLHRVQQIADVAIDEGRSIFPLGRSMVNNVRIAKDLGLLDIPDRAIRPIEELDQFDSGKVCVICTGSQGEPNAALSLMVRGEHNDLTISPDDVVMLSSHPIPGNEIPVYRIIDRLTRVGCEVVHDGHEHVHTTGHARRDELRLLQSVTRPQWFVPIEGEYRMMRRHADLAIDMGLDEGRVIVAVDGQRLVIDDHQIKPEGRIPASYRYVDGLLDDLGPEVLEERRALSTGGFVNVTVVVGRDRQRRSAPVITTQGWLDVDKSADVLGRLEVEVTEAVDRALCDNAALEDLERLVRRTTGRFVGNRTRRRPPIVASVIILD
jgi:ribonuclease J